jgi:hypothetical protein
MVSLEPIFNPVQDAWFDLDSAQGKVELRKREFETRGDVDAWLTSKAFDLRSTRSIDTEKLVAEASRLLHQENPDPAAIRDIHRAIHASLPPQDNFLSNWRYIAEKKGLLT